MSMLKKTSTQVDPNSVFGCCLGCCKAGQFTVYGLKLVNFGNRPPTPNEVAQAMAEVRKDEDVTLRLLLCPDCLNGNLEAIRSKLISVVEQMMGGIKCEVNLARDYGTLPKDEWPN